MSNSNSKTLFQQCVNLCDDYLGFEWSQGVRTSSFDSYRRENTLDPNLSIYHYGGDLFKVESMNYDDSKGYFISPTVILTSNPNYITMNEEIFGPVVTIFIYPDDQWKEILKTVDNTSIYALTGAFISNDKESIEYALKHLRYSAGNFYINDKPSGAVVGQQPFGGSRGSGTNDKAGSKLNLLRWVSPRLIKENFSPPTDYPYPYME